jgi:hypothetical protein
MTVANNEPTPLCPLYSMRMGHAVMDIGAQERLGPADVLRFAETHLPEVGSSDVLKRVHRATVGPHAPPILRGAAYIAALKGDPWRPQV